jgi:hypothetical protein
MASCDNPHEAAHYEEFRSYPPELVQEAMSGPIPADDVRFKIYFVSESDVRVRIDWLSDHGVFVFLFYSFSS